METTNIFEEATKKKFRFPYKGQCSTEDLWDLGLRDLDSIFKSLNEARKEATKESLLDEKSPQDIELEDKIAIVKYIVSFKKSEIAERAVAKEKKAYDQKIMEIIARKENQELENLSIEELKARLSGNMKEEK